jgi:hypothetical protein
MTGSDCLQITVQELLLAFRAALASLTPYMDQLRIGWRDLEAYDDWDEIAQILYKNTVLRSIQFRRDVEQGFPAAEYGMVHTCYDHYSFLEIGDQLGQIATRRVFVAFSTREQPFDQVLFQEVSASDLRAAGDLQSMSVEDAKFCFVLNMGSGLLTRISDLSVQV